VDRRRAAGFAGVLRRPKIQETLVARHPVGRGVQERPGLEPLLCAELRLDCEGCKPAVLVLLERSRKIFTSLHAASPDDKSHARNLARSPRQPGAGSSHETDEAKTRASLKERDRPWKAEHERPAAGEQRAEDPEDLYQLALVESLEAPGQPNRLGRTPEQNEVTPPRPLPRKR